MILGRFKGKELTRAASPPVPTKGDKFEAVIQGQTIVVYWNGVEKIRYTDNDPSKKITSGIRGSGSISIQGLKHRLRIHRMTVKSLPPGNGPGTSPTSDSGSLGLTAASCPGTGARRMASWDSDTCSSKTPCDRGRWCSFGERGTWIARRSPCCSPLRCSAVGPRARTTCRPFRPPRSYHEFDGTENPISEGGIWVHRDATLTTVRTMGGVAYGTQTGSGPHAPYDDSNAYLTGLEMTTVGRHGVSPAWNAELSQS